MARPQAVIAVGLLLGLMASSAPAGPPDLGGLLGHLPPGWTTLPPGDDPDVLAVIAGPWVGEVRFTVSVARVPDGAWIDGMASDAGRKALAAAIEAGTSGLDLVRIVDNEVFDGPEIHAQLRSAPGLELRFYLVPGSAPRLITLTGPREGFEAVHVRLLKGLKSLAGRRK